MATTRVCLQCGAVLPGRTAAWLCPRCLLLQAAAPVPPETTLSSASLTAGESTTFHYFGDYELLHEIARGGMGVVYKARQVSLNRTVAVKVLLFGKLAGTEFIKRFRAEAAAAASLQHPNIVAIHEVGEHEGQQYFSMDYVAGCDLASLVRANPLPVQRAAAYVKTIAEAIHYAHQRGILHRDLKPSNVLIDADDQLRVTDFGLAKRLMSDTGGLPLDPQLTLTGQVVGTPAYMPPEQAGGQRGVLGPASDVYSLGALLYFLLTARAPFAADSLDEVLRQVHEAEPVSPRLLNATIPRDLETISLKCLNKEPARRYPSALALAEDLGRFLQDEPIRARPVSRREKVWRWCRRKPLLAALIVALHLVAAAGLGGILWQWRRAEAHAKETQIYAAEAVAKLREAYIAQAQANRLSGRPGQRFDTLAAITNAVALQPPPAQRTRLRNMAISAMSLPDLLPIWTLENREATWKGGSIDLPRSRYALVTTAGRVEVRHVPDNALLFELPEHHTPAHLPLAFSPDGKYLGVSYTNARVVIWHLEQREPLVEETGDTVWLESLAFNPESTRVAIASTSPTVAVLDLVTRRPLCRITNEVAMEFVAFDPAGHRLAIGSRKHGMVRIVDAATGATLRELEHPSPTQPLAWHPVHPLLAVGCGDGLVRFWNPDTGEHIARGVAENGECGGTVFSHRGDVLVNASWSRMVMWRPTVPLSFGTAIAEALTLQPTFRGIGNGGLLRFDEDDRHLSRNWWGTPQPKLEIDAITCAPEVRVFRSPRPAFGFLRFTLNHDGTLAALALADAVSLLDVETGIELARLPLAGARAPLFLPEQAGLVATSEQGLFTWSFQPGLTAGELGVEPPRCLSAGLDYTQLRLSSRGGRLAVWHNDHGHVYSVPDLHPISRIGTHFGGEILGPSFSADEELIATSRWNNPNIGIWQVANSNLLHSIKVTHSRGEMIGRAAFTPDGQWLFVSAQEDLRLYKPEDWTLHASIPWKGGANQLAFLASGKVVAVTTDTTAVAVHLLTIPEFRELAVLETASNIAIAHLGTSGDSLKLFAVREDGEINIWNLPLLAAGLEELGLAWDSPLPSPGSHPMAALPRFRVENPEP